MLPGKKYGPQDAVRILKHRWWMIAGPAVVGGFVALMVSASLPNTYQSETLIQIVPQRVPDAYVRSTVTERTENRMDSLEALVKSRSQLEQLIREFDLYPAERQALPFEDVINRMRLAIEVELVRPYRGLPPDSFFVRFMYADPALAARVTTRLGGMFVAQNADDRIKRASTTSEFLVTKVEESKHELMAHERKMEQFRQRYAGRLPSQAEVNMQAIQSNQSQLQALIESSARDRDRKLMLERLYNEALAEPLPVSAAATVASPTSEAATAATMPLSQQLELARAAQSRLEMRLKPNHPDVRRARKMVSDLEAQVTAAAKDTPANSAAPPVTAAVNPEAAQRRARLAEMKAEIESLDRQLTFKAGEEAQLRQKIADYQQRVESVPGIESEWIALTRDYETLSNNYKTYLQKSEESKVAADLEKRQVGEQFRVLDPARVPVKPVGPVRLMINAIGLGVGLVLGLLVVALLELRDTTFRSESDVLDVLHLPVLATVPLVESDVDRRRHRFTRMMVSLGVFVAVASGGYVCWSLELWKHVV